MKRSRQTNALLAPKGKATPAAAEARGRDTAAARASAGAASLSAEIVHQGRNRPARGKATPPNPNGSTPAPCEAERVRVSLRLDTDRYLRLKLVAAHREQTLQSILTRALDDYLACQAPDVLDAFRHLSKRAESDSPNPDRRKMAPLSRSMEVIRGRSRSG